MRFLSVNVAGLKPFKTLQSSRAHSFFDLIECRNFHRLVKSLGLGISLWNCGIMQQLGESALIVASALSGPASALFPPRYAPPPLFPGGPESIPSRLRF